MYNSLSHVPTDKEVDIAAIIESAAKEYWVTTGTTRLIDKFIEEYPNEISRITEDLIREYQVNKFGTPNQRVSTNQRRLAGSVSLTSTALDVFKPLGRQFEKDEFLSLCFYGGYLTRRTIGTVCIPNQELFMVWRKMFGRIATGPEMTNELENCPKGKLLEDLWANDTDFLCSLVKSSHSALANHNDFKEREYADHASAAFHVAAVFGALTPSSQPNVRISDLVMSRESHVGRGKCDCLMRLYSTTNRPNGFGVLVEYKTIPHNLRATVTQDLARGPNANDDGAIEEEVVRRQKEIAEKGLLQITTASYATGLAGCLERMDVCLAINNDTVYAVSQLYKRSNIGVEWRKVDSLL
ncbi:hypothetical protein GGI24_004932 [Coemansia furcata]|nr:hypothetical protein GGI24_004932 [Coemansia furcata]